MTLICGFVAAEAPWTIKGVLSEERDQIFIREQKWEWWCNKCAARMSSAAVALVDVLTFYWNKQNSGTAELKVQFVK